MHDLKDLEDRGVVSVGVATTEFVQAAAAQNKALGYEPAVVFVPHPIQDRSNAELRALAEQAIDAILKSLVK
jgi:vacuolar-type H+-ATPase subunit F/Vma7